MEKLDIKCIISGDETGGKVAVFEEIVPPGSGPPRHTHRNQLEVFHVIEGSIQFEVSGDLFERKAGAAAVVPAGAVHAFRNIGATPAVIHFEMLPAGDSEEAFRLLVRGEVSDVSAFFDEYGMDLSGPPLAWRSANKRAMNRWHTTVMPKAHYTNIFDMPPEILQEIMSTTKQVVELYWKKLSSDAVQIISSNGKAAQQGVFHSHVHLAPRHKGDGQDVKWKLYPEMVEDYHAMLEQLGRGKLIDAPIR